MVIQLTANEPKSGSTPPVISQICGEWPTVSVSPDCLAVYFPAVGGVPQEASKTSVYRVQFSAGMFHRLIWVARLMGGHQTCNLIVSVQIGCDPVIVFSLQRNNLW